MTKVIYGLVCGFAALVFIVVSYLFLTNPAVFPYVDDLPPAVDTSTERAGFYQKIIIPAAIVLGGIFALYRLQIERTHAQRLQVAISSEPIAVDEKLYLAVQLTCSNVGQSAIKLTAQRSEVTFSFRKANPSLRFQPSNPTTFPAEDITLEPSEVLLESAWCEEAISDWTAVEIEVYIAENLRRSRSYKSIVSIQSLRNEQNREVVCDRTQKTDLIMRQSCLGRLLGRFSRE